MKTKNKRILLNKIDFDDFSCSVWAWSDYSAVCESIKNTGIINPPTVIKGRLGTYRIISGHKRLRAAQHIGMKEVMCNVSIGPVNQCQLFIHTVQENISFRNYNLVEKSMIVNRLGSSSLCGKDVDNLYSKIGVGRHNMLNIKKIHGFCPVIKKAIACGKVHETIALKLAEVKKTDRKAFVNLLDAVNLNQNKQREILQVLQDLSRLEKRTVKEILSTPEIKSILTDPELNDPQRIIRLRDALRYQRYPGITAFEQKAEAAKRKISFCENIQVMNQPPYENDQLNLSVRIKDRKDIKKAIEALRKMGGMKDIEKIIRRITGIDN